MQKYNPDVGPRVSNPTWAQKLGPCTLRGTSSLLNATVLMGLVAYGVTENRRRNIRPTPQPTPIAIHLHER